MLETRFVGVLSFQKSACLFTFISGDFSPTVDEHSFKVFISKAHNEQGILLFIHWKKHRGYCLKNHKF